MTAEYKMLLDEVTEDKIVVDKNDLAK